MRDFTVRMFCMQLQYEKARRLEFIANPYCFRK